MESLPVPTASTCLSPDEDEQYISQQLSSRQIDDFVILNPGGGWDTKNWAPENYALLHDKLPPGNRVAQRSDLGTRVKSRSWTGFCARASEPHPLRSQPRSTQLIALLKRAKLFVGGDTGPLHLAAACGTPIVGIFGPTDPQRNGPFSPEDIVVSHQVPCGPCYKRTCPIYNKECLRLVQVDEVFQAVLRRLGKKVLWSSPDQSVVSLASQNLFDFMAARTRRSKIPLRLATYWRPSTENEMGLERTAPPV